MLDNPSQLLPFLIIGIILISIITSYYFSNKQKIRRALTKLPSTSVTNFKNDTLTKITGKALHVKDPLIAPYSKRKCISYWIKVEKKQGKNSWETLLNEEKIQEFFIQNNGEYVIIKPVKHGHYKNYISHLVIDRKTSSGTFNNPSLKFETLLKEYNIDSTGLFGFNKTLRFYEGIIEVGETITVAGIAKWKKLSEPIEGYAYSKIATLESSDTQKLLITDLPDVAPKKKRR